MSQNWEELTDTKGNTYYRKRKIANGVLEVKLNSNSDAYIGSFISTDNKITFIVDHYPQKPDKPFPPTYYGSFDCRKWTAQKYGLLFTSHKMLGPNKNPMYTPENPIKPRISSYIPKTKPKVAKPIKPIKKKMTLTEEAIEYGKSGPLIVAND